MRLLALLGMLANLAVGAVRSVRRSTAKAECSGKIICPLTGEEICPCCCPLNGVE